MANVVLLTKKHLHGAEMMPSKSGNLRIQDSQAFCWSSCHLPVRFRHENKMENNTTQSQDVGAVSAHHGEKVCISKQGMEPSGSLSAPSIRTYCYGGRGEDPAAGEGRPFHGGPEQNSLKHMGGQIPMTAIPFNQWDLRKRRLRPSRRFHWVFSFQERLEGEVRE